MILEKYKFMHHGREFVCKLYDDDMQRAPWKDDCGAAVVTEGYRRPKRPWERILHEDRGHKWFLDVRATRKRALKDGWGIGAKKLAELEARLGRAPTRKEIVAQAIEQQYDYICGWLRNDWCYVGVEVTDVVSGDSDSIWGIESDCEFVKEYRDELAYGLHPLANVEEACVLGYN